MVPVPTLLRPAIDRLSLPFKARVPELPLKVMTLAAVLFKAPALFTTTLPAPMFRPLVKLLLPDSVKVPPPW